MRGGGKMKTAGAGGGKMRAARLKVRSGAVRRHIVDRSPPAGGQMLTSSPLHGTAGMYGSETGMCPVVPGKGEGWKACGGVVYTAAQAQERKRSCHGMCVVGALSQAKKKKAQKENGSEWQ